MSSMERIAAAYDRVNTEVMPALLAAFEGKAEQIAPTNDQIPQVHLVPDALEALAPWLRDLGFSMLVDIGGVDYYPRREPRFEVVYHFRQLATLGLIRIRVRCSDKDLVPTLSSHWPMANPAEREVYDQFGIRFAGHPNLTRILNPDDWEGHPLRRDYPVRGPRSLINLEMPADENRYHPFVAEDSPKENGK